ncbi:glycosyltransferase [Acrocarpospora catenulata]|uniref:glycosyltransferase n=1 Tax=Acrocarpospora catenulata TaxID=2836182 RepID=UPI0027E1F991|nr:glycosyltransferase [Acrocarpospora catenulata]
MPRPRIRHNDYSPLVPAELGRWQPSLPVSVVIPAYGGQSRLDLTLAALSAQSYPAELTEVIVVDDGSTPPLRLPEIRPENTRLISSGPGGSGPAHAVRAGVAVAEGTVVQRLDADMVPYREHLEALLRWQHLTDYLVTIGGKVFAPEPPLTPEQVRDAVAGDTVESLIDLSEAVPSSTEATIRRLDGLRASRNPYHVCTGPTMSLHRAFYAAAGGFDPEVRRGEDTEFAYRLAQLGAVFVPDLAARAVHLELPSQRREGAAAVRAVQPFLANRIPLRRDLRKERARIWRVPYVEVVLDVAGAAEPRVRKAVEAALTGTLPDVAVTLVGPWSSLPGQGDELAELELLSAGFKDDPRVRLADQVAPTAFPVPFRFTGPVDPPLAPDTLERLTRIMVKERLGLLYFRLPNRRLAALERTEAVSRARLVARPDEPLTQVIEQTHGVRHPAEHHLADEAEKRTLRERLARIRP